MRLREAFNRLQGLYFRLYPKSEPPQEGLRSGLVGCGHFVQHAYVPALNRSHNPVAIAGLYSRSGRSSQMAAEMLRYKTRIFDSYESLLDSGVETVIITVPNYLHPDFVIQAIEKKIDVFCEKPIANSLTDAFRLKRALEKSGRILMVGFNQRYFDRMNKIKLLIERRYIGEPLEVQAFHNQNVGEHLGQSDWLNDIRKSGGGVLHNAGVHLINIMTHLFGEVEKVSARLENRKLPVSFGEDTASCELLFKSGVRGRIDASYINGAPSTYEHLIIKGTKGVLITDMLKSNIECMLGPDGKKREIPCRREVIVDSLFNELSHFCDCVQKRENPNTDIDDAIKTLCVIEAAAISSNEKREVSSDEIERKYAFPRQ